MTSPVTNRLLFSEVFFQQIRQETADLDNLRATLGTIQDTWRYYLPSPADGSKLRWQPESPIDKDDVAQLRMSVVEQIFAYMELTYGPCQADSRAFFLFGDWSMQDRTGLCLVLPYSANIEGRDSKTGFIPKGRNYAQQLVRLLRDHGLDWGVLTNGRHWRLYHRSELSPTDTYLDIDLERIVIEDDMQDYVVFHRFFSRLAFARQDNLQRLDLYKQQSDAAAKAIESHLSSQVEEIVRQFCQGLVESCRSKGEDVTHPTTRSDIYKNALFLVYRLLFVLYAEARELLPLEIRAYRDVCLADLLDEVHKNHQDGLANDDDHAIWMRLQALFALIDQGDSMAKVPAYNGGLFAPNRRRFLVDHRIRNSYLQTALIRLSTVPARGKSYDQDRQPKPIDYRDLSVRHLGSLYEGLLEYNLFVVADEARVVRAGKKHTEYVSLSQAGKVRVSETVLQVGDVYFSETEGERKATGSYYTPEDVVDYIVRNTVVHKLIELRAEFYTTYHIQRQLDDLANTPPDIPAHGQIQRALDEQFHRFVWERVLILKILDMAMGSGHFLVNVIHAVANFIVEFLNETPWENLDIDTDVATWRRRVAERCIFGVDLNELAVELAKLCLWMTTAAKGKPLTFLDHHLRWGNSLVGAWLSDIGRYPLAKKEGEQALTLPVTWFQLKLDEVLAKYQELYAKSSDDVDEVREKARIFEQEIYPALQPYRELFTLHTGIYFGNGLDEATYARLGAAIDNPAAWASLKIELRLDRLLETDNKLHWLNWELEFPEVFITRVEQQGFSIILGNPPYGQIEDVLLMRYLAQVLNDRTSADYRRYPHAWNVYSPLLENLLPHVASQGYFGFVIPNSSVCATAYERLRNLFRHKASKLFVLNYSIRPQPLFPGVMQRVAIVHGGCEPTTKEPLVFTTRYFRLTSENRKNLVSSPPFANSTSLAWNNPKYVPKLGSEVDCNIYRCVTKSSETVEALTVSRSTENAMLLYFHDSGESYWTKILNFAPPATRNGQKSVARGWSNVCVDRRYAGFVTCLINSGLFYWYWLATTDCRHLYVSNVLECPIPLRSSIESRLGEFDNKANQLMNCYRRNLQLTEKRKGYESPEIGVRKCKRKIDEIDELLGRTFGFDESWLQHIKSYDAEFREWGNDDGLFQDEES